MEYRKGSSVRVNAGVTCPEKPELDISGWQGRIIETSTEAKTGRPLVTIAWDSATLRAMPPDFIEESAREEMEWATLTLYPEEVEPARARDTRKDVEQALDELEARYKWLGWGEEGDRIFAVVSGAASLDELDVMKAWQKHLQGELEFPFPAMVSPVAEGSPLAGEMITVTGIDYVDEEMGVMAACTVDGTRHLCALADVAPLDEESPGAEAISDYQLWFENS